MTADTAEVFVALSDYFIALECGVFAVLLTRDMSIARFQAWVVAFFVAASLSALLGGVTHGFLADVSAQMRRFFWLASMISIGLGGLTAYVISIELLGICRSWLWLALLAFLVYVWDILFISADFRTAVAFYLPATVLLLVSFLVVYFRRRQRAPLIGAGATLLSFAAAFVQQSGWDLHAVYLDHNTVFHLIQAVSFYGLFVAFRSMHGREKQICTPVG